MSRLVFVLLIGWLIMPCAVSARESEYFAYGASAQSKELVAIHVKGDRASVMQRIPIGIEAAPVVYHSKKQLLYVASLRAKNSTNKLLTFRVASDGRLTRLSAMQSKHGCAYLSLDRSGQFLLAASYFEGYVDVYQLNSSGVPVSVTDTVYEQRDKAHSIRVTKDNRFAYVPYVKDQNGLFQYKFDSRIGKLTHLPSSASGNHQAKVGKNAGPRHVVHHPNGRFIYFSNEQHLGVSAYRVDSSTGKLSLIQICDAGELKESAGVAASDIVVTPDGRFLFVGVRDFQAKKVDAIHRYAILPNGKVKHLGSTQCDSIPWGLELSPDGGNLLCTAAHGETFTSYRIGADGSLSKSLSLKWGRMIRAIAVFAPKK